MKPELKPNSKNAAAFLAGGRCRNPNSVALDGLLLLLEIICTSTQASIHLFSIRCAAKAHPHCACTANLLKTCWSYSYFRMCQLGLSLFNWTEVKQKSWFELPGSSVFMKGEKKEENTLNFILNAPCQTLSRPPEWWCQWWFAGLSVVSSQKMRSSPCDRCHYVLKKQCKWDESQPGCASTKQMLVINCSFDWCGFQWWHKMNGTPPEQAGVRSKQIKGVKGDH